MPEPASFDTAYITAHVNRKLGASKVQVELVPADIEGEIEDTLELFQRYRPKRLMQSSLMPQGVHLVQGTPTGNMGVLDVDYVAQDRFDSQSVEAALLYDPFYFISSGALGGVDLQLIDLVRRWMKLVGRVLSAAFDWEATDEGLFIYTPFAAKVTLTWAMPYENELTDVHREYQTLFLNIVLAKSRQILGQIRSKYSGVPGAGGRLQMDGEWQRDKGAADEERYTEELMRTTIDYIPTYG